VRRPLAFRRRFVDALLKHLAGMGGGGVIAIITLIFGYLLFVAAPAFKTPSVTELDIIDAQAAAALPANPASHAPLQTRRHVFGADDTYALLDADGYLNFFRSRPPRDGETHPPQPSHTWQSSASESDFEPKFSFVPLIVGTFKAAFYAMLIAVPIAVLGAIYTAYFMAPAMRRLIKPGIEVMAAMPTVVLGFLAGLWLAPLVESHLTATLLSFIALPASVLLLSRLASLLPDQYARMIEPWLGALSVPLIALMVWLLFRFDAALESLLFSGDAQYWLRTVLGLDYDQRNALIVGIAMGIAVVPVIFSISEDAIHGVPRHLTSGSLALGATPWQTLSNLVVPFASPGIFSAIMIGFGRAVGETMIVLMVAGNTPLANMNLFEGMRTFAANIAIELPESEVGSSHFRLLFLSALILFVVTFAFNTVAEVVRTRLRKRYASL